MLDFLKCLGKNMRMADFDKAQALLQAQKGAMNPFSLVNDHEHAVANLIIDEKLFEFEFWSFHPMENTATIEISQADVLKFLESHEVKYEKANVETAPVQ